MLVSVSHSLFYSSPLADSSSDSKTDCKILCKEDVKGCDKYVQFDANNLSRMLFREVVYRPGPGVHLLSITFFAVLVLKHRH